MSTVANVVDGKVDISESSQDTERKVGSSLGKEDFLLLLVTQMQYQDPLSPMENTEYVSQLAQFTELEKMENLNNTATNNSAFSLVGKEVYIQQTSSTGEIMEVQGTVEFVVMQNGKPFVSVDGELYSYDDIVKVIDPYYLVSQYVPSVTEQTVTYLHQDPQNIQITGVNLGSNGYQATSIGAVIVNPDGTTTAVDTKYLTYKDGTLTIDKAAFTGLDAGKYHIALAFNDANETINYDSVTLEVKGIKPDVPDDDDDDPSGGGSGDDDDPDGTNTES